jgi:hypothetical protein
LISCQKCGANDCRAIEFRAVHPHSSVVLTNVCNTGKIQWYKQGIKQTIPQKTVGFVL